MALCDVRHETGPADRDLVQQISDLADRVIPVLESVTALRVGPSPVIRILTPDVWMLAVQADARRWAQRDIDDMNLDPEQAERRMSVAAGHNDSLRTIWPLVTGTSIQGVDGEPQALLVPQALHASGFQEPQLLKVLAHLVTQTAQHRAGDGAAFLAQNTAYPIERGVDPQTVPYVVSGYARWADLQVTTRIIGREVGEDTGRQTDIWETANEQAKERFGDGQEPLPGPEMAAFTAGSDWFRTVVGKVGTTAVNTMWRHITLMPTREELTEPDRWIARIS
jgi:hypothetical protein